MSVLLLAIVLFLSLLLIPIGLPGTWAMVVAGVLHSFLVPGSGIGGIAVIGCTVIALVAELPEAVGGQFEISLKDWSAATATQP